MIHLTVYRSSARDVLKLAVGVILVLAALDIAVLHQVAGPPDVDGATGQITSRGLSQQRADYLWGAAFVVAGAGLVLAGLGSLVTRVPVVEITDEGLRLRIAGPRTLVAVPWRNVLSLRSSSDGDDEVVPPRVIRLEVLDASSYPAAPWAAEWEGSTLVVDADSWNVPAVEVVAHARMAFDAWQWSSGLGVNETAETGDDSGEVG